MSGAATHSSFHNLPDYSSKNIILPKRDFMLKLHLESIKKCNNILNSDENLNENYTNSSKVCQREFMIAGACVLLKKANIHFGDVRDPVYDCRHEIEIAQNSLLKNFGNFPLEKMDDWLLKLQRSIKPFV